MLISLEQKRILSEYAAEVIAATYKAKRAADDTYEAAMRRCSASLRRFNEKFLSIRASKKITKALENERIVHQYKSDIQKINELVNAISIYTKSKQLPRRVRRQTTLKYDIPGYSKKQKTAAFKPIDLPSHSPKLVLALNESNTPSESINFSS